MSNRLDTFRNKFADEYEGFGTESNKMSVTAFMGGDKYGSGIQVTLNEEFFRLNENQVEELIELLQKRLDCVDGYSATDTRGEHYEH